MAFRQIKSLKVDDKYTVKYDEKNNDGPVMILRKGESWRGWNEMAQHSNLWLAMFHSLLKARKRIAAAEALIDDLYQHEGAEGFSQSTNKLLAAFQETE